MSLLLRTINAIEDFPAYFVGVDSVLFGKMVYHYFSEYSPPAYVEILKTATELYRIEKICNNLDMYISGETRKIIGYPKVEFTDEELKEAALLEEIINGTVVL